MAILALALVGSVLGDSPSLTFRQQEEYFRYEGAIMTSILNPRQSHSGTNLTMDITLTRRGQVSYFAFQNVKARTFNSEFFFAGELPPSSPQSVVEKLQGNFSVYLGRESGVVMKVPQGEELWVTNIRKAIVSMFKIPAYTIDYQQSQAVEQRVADPQSDPIMRPAYSQKETTFAGRCNSSYTISYDYANGTYPNTYKGWSFPQQGQQPSQWQPRFYRLRRSIDFDSCWDPVRYVKSSYGNFSEVQHSQFKGLQSRSMLGQYVLVAVYNSSKWNGAETQYTMYYIKGANQYSTQFIRPFGQNTGRIAVITNQTLYGVSQPFQRLPISQQTQDVRTWMYQFASPVSAQNSGSQPEWVQYQGKSDRLQPIYPEYSILGFHPKSQEQLKAFAQQALEEITRLQQEPISYHNKPYNGTIDGRLVDRLKQLTQVIRALEKSQIQSLYQSVPNGQQVAQKIKRQSFLDAAAASGSSAAIEVLLEAFRNQQVDTFRQAGLISVLVANIHDPASIGKLVDYVITLEPSKSLYLSSLAYINVAMVLQRVCSDSGIQNYAVPREILGVKVCDQQFVTKFIQHLEAKIESNCPEYEKMLYVQSLGRVGQSSTIQFLSNIVNDQFNEKEYPSKVKLAAIYGLTKNFHKWSQKQQIIQSLLPLVLSPSEPFELRHAALINVVYQQPNATVFEILARQTWFEPSFRMRSLLTSVFTTYSEDRDPEFAKTINVARKYLPLIRAMNPSFNYSGYFPVRDVLPGYGIEIKRTIAWLDQYVSPYSPRQMYKSFAGVYGGIAVPIAEVYSVIQSESDSHYSSTPMSPRDPQNRRNHEAVSSIAEALNIGMLQTVGKQLYFTFGFFNIEIFLPVTPETIDRLVNAVIHEASKTPTQSRIPIFDMEHAVKYFNPVDYCTILPTPFGLPSIIEAATPTNWYWGNDFKVFSPQGQRNAINMTVDGMSKLTRKAQFLASVLIPWSQQASVAAYDVEATLSYPGKLSLVMNATFPYIISKMDVQPSFTGERPLFYYRSKPFTALRSMPPASDITTVESLITPLANSSYAYNTSIWLPENAFGVKGRIDYQGDVDFPFNQRVITKVVQNPAYVATLLTTPSQHDFTFALKVNMEQSQTKKISLSSVIDIDSLWNGYRTIRMNEQNQNRPTGENVAQQLSARMSPEEIVIRSREGISDRVVASIGVNYTAPGVRSRNYLGVFTASEPKEAHSEQYYQRDFVVNLMKSGVQSPTSEAKTCLVVNLKEQKAPARTRSPEQQFAEATTTLYGGSKCSQSEKAISAKTLFFMTTLMDNRRQQQGELMSSNILVPSERRYDPAEVTAWKQDSFLNRVKTQFTIESGAPRYLLNASYILSDFLAGYAFPHVVVNHMPSQQQPQGQCIVDMIRNNFTGTFDARISSQQSQSVVQQLPIAPLIDWMTPVIGPRWPLARLLKDNLRSEEAPGKTCTLTPSAVKTYDSVSYSKTPTACEEVATFIYHVKKSLGILAQQPSSGLGFVRIIDARAEAIEVTSDLQVKVNEELRTESEIQLKNTQNKVIGKIVKSSEYVLVQIYDQLSLTFSKQKVLKITLSEKYRSLTSGLCGSFSGEKMKDLITKDRCALTSDKGSVYAASWLNSPQTCEEAPLQREIQEYEQIKQTCQKIHF